jgi:hypothetical protein
VCLRDVQLFGGHRAGDRRVHITDDDHGIDVPLRGVALVSDHHPSLCSAWVPEPTSRFTFRLREAQNLEEPFRHPLVIVLPGVDEFDVRCGSSARITGPTFRSSGGRPRPR